MMRQRNTQSSGLMVRIIIGVVMIIFSIISYMGSQEFNEVTGENQYLSLSVDQEIALGLQSAPELIQQFGGRTRNAQLQSRIEQIGVNLVRNSIANNTPWRFQFHVLEDRQTVNAFALPGGQVFITEAMLSRLSNDHEIAGVLAHEIVHVLARHSAQRIAQNDLTNGIIGAVSVASGDASTAQTAAMIGQLINMSYGRDDEIQSDTIGVCLMIDAGYNPEGMLGVMRVLNDLSGGRGDDFFSTHPSPSNRIERIEQAIANAQQDCRFQ
jgi:predicted Zn-dependent protease